MDCWKECDNCIEGSSWIFKYKEEPENDGFKFCPLSLCGREATYIIRNPDCMRQFGRCLLPDCRKKESLSYGNWNQGVHSYTIRHLKIQPLFGGLGSSIKRKVA